jgi:hypothetical protein
MLRPGRWAQRCRAGGSPRTSAPTSPASSRPCRSLRRDVLERGACMARTSECIRQPCAGQSRRAREWLDGHDPRRLRWPDIRRDDSNVAPEGEKYPSLCRSGVPAGPFETRDVEAPQVVVGHPDTASLWAPMMPNGPFSLVPWSCVAVLCSASGWRPSWSRRCAGRTIGRTRRSWPASVTPSSERV